MQETSSYLENTNRRSARTNSAAAQMTDFVRYGMLDAYELNDDDLAQMLELWRWTVWMRANQPNGIDHDVLEAVHSLQRKLAQNQNADLEYNTAILLKQDIEALMYLRCLFNAPRAVWYFARRMRVFTLMRAFIQSRRYSKMQRSYSEGSAANRGYPRHALEHFHGKAPDMMKRHYWRSLTFKTFQERKHCEMWW